MDGCASAWAPGGWRSSSRRWTGTSVPAAHGWTSVHFFLNPPPSATQESRPQYVANLPLLTHPVAVPVAVAVCARGLGTVGVALVVQVVAVLADGRGLGAAPRRASWPRREEASRLRTARAITPTTIDKSRLNMDAPFQGLAALAEAPAFSRK